MWFYFTEMFDRILELQLDFMQNSRHGNVIPNHARAGTSTAVARCVANSFNDLSQLSRKL